MKLESKLPKELGNLVKSARLKTGRTQIETARILGVSQSKLSKIENGVLLPSLPEWARFCEAFDQDSDAILYQLGILKNRPRSK